MNSVKPFEFYILGYDVWKYCDMLIEQCGENSEIIQVLDKKYDEIEQAHHKWEDVLTAIRRFLSENGYVDEIEKLDKEFAKEYQDREKEYQHKSMAVRWEAESEEIAKEILKAKTI